MLKEVVGDIDCRKDEVEIVVLLRGRVDFELVMLLCICCVIGFVMGKDSA